MNLTGITIVELEERFEMVAASDSEANIDVTYDQPTGTVLVGTHINF
jgi:hypothetical protein